MVSLLEENSLSQGTEEAYIGSISIASLNRVGYSF
jgi:hypothetical protein